MGPIQLGFATRIRDSDTRLGYATRIHVSSNHDAISYGPRGGPRHVRPCFLSNPPPHSYPLYRASLGTACVRPQSELRKLQDRLDERQRRMLEEQDR